MKVRIKRRNLVIDDLKKSKARHKRSLKFFTASRYEDGKLQAFSIMTELKGK
jgi:hypothetical protein|nr:MAG TPA: hypothetical protein [Caudoviricetes sp.]